MFGIIGYLRECLVFYLVLLVFVLPNGFELFSFLKHLIVFSLSDGSYYCRNEYCALIYVIFTFLPKKIHLSIKLYYKWKLQFLFFNKLNNKITEIVHELYGQPSYVHITMYHCFTNKVLLPVTWYQYCQCRYYYFPKINTL